MCVRSLSLVLQGCLEYVHTCLCVFFSYYLTRRAFLSHSRVPSFSLVLSFLRSFVLCMVCSARYPTQRVPKEWKKAPVWLPLQSKAYPRCKAKVLVAFELVPAEKAEDDTYPFFDDIRPSTKEGLIRLFLIGLRMYKPLTQPSVTVSLLAPHSTQLTGGEGGGVKEDFFSVYVVFSRSFYACRPGYFSSCPGCEDIEVLGHFKQAIVSTGASMYSCVSAYSSNVWYLSSSG